MAIELGVLSPYPAKQTVSILNGKLDIIKIDTEFSCMTVSWKGKYVWLYFCKNNEAGTPVPLDDDSSRIFVVAEFSHAFIKDGGLKKEMDQFVKCLTQLGFVSECSDRT